MYILSKMFPYTELLMLAYLTLVTVSCISSLDCFSQDLGISEQGC